MKSRTADQSVAPFGIIRAGEASASLGQHVGVDDVDWCSVGVGEDLVEYVGELDFVLVAGDVSDMWGADRVLHGKERVVWVDQRLVFVDVNGGASRAAGAQGLDECAVFDQSCSAGVDQ